jgi:hypothetical protein
MKRSALMFVVFVLTAVVTSGCGGGSKVETAKVSGTVQLDGKPLDGAEVNFVAEEYAGIATTDSSGNFELEAQPGENTVFISKYEGADPSFDETMISESDTGGPAEGPKQMVPEKYSDASKTELKFTVPDDGSTDANFDLSTK